MNKLMGNMMARVITAKRKQGGCRGRRVMIGRGVEGRLTVRARWQPAPEGESIKQRELQILLINLPETLSSRAAPLTE